MTEYIFKNDLVRAAFEALCDRCKLDPDQEGQELDEGWDIAID